MSSRAPAGARGHASLPAPAGAGFPFLPRSGFAAGGGLAAQRPPSACTRDAANFATISVSRKRCGAQPCARVAPQAQLCETHISLEVGNAPARQAGRRNLNALGRRPSATRTAGGAQRAAERRAVQRRAADRETSAVRLRKYVSCCTSSGSMSGRPFAL